MKKPFLCLEKGKSGNGRKRLNKKVRLGSHKVTIVRLAVLESLEGPSHRDGGDKSVNVRDGVLRWLIEWKGHLERVSRERI